ncbi:unnamed protein product [Sphagnum jensenii]|uniref:Uncharacterized protein n=1 Tax=Sphagnum jensenii TaxID=128206 RepID=A0ABP1ADD7_9BRYO
MGSNARQSLRLRRVSLPLLARWRRPRSPLAGGGGGQQRGPHGQTEAAKRADRSVSKGQRAGHGGRQKRAKGRGPGHTGRRKMGRKKKRAECWAHRNGQKARD